MQVRETVTSLASRFGQQSLHCTSGINLSNEDVPNKDILDNSSQSLHFFWQFLFLKIFIYGMKKVEDKV